MSPSPLSRGLRRYGAPSLSRVVQGYRADEQLTRHQERTVSLAVAVGGVEIRPTRAFFWVGSRDSGRQWIYSLGMEPRLLRGPRRRRHVELGSFRLSFLGNPAYTLLLFGARLARGQRRLPEGQRKR